MCLRLCPHWSSLCLLEQSLRLAQEFVCILYVVANDSTRNTQRAQHDSEIELEVKEDRGDDGNDNHGRDVRHYQRNVVNMFENNRYAQTTGRAHGDDSPRPAAIACEEAAGPIRGGVGHP